METPVKHAPNHPEFIPENNKFLVSYGDLEDFFEAIKTESGNKGGWNACEHYKRTVTPGIGTIHSGSAWDAGNWIDYPTPARINVASTSAFGSSFPWGTAGGPFLDQPVLYADNSYMRGVIPPGSWSSLVEDAYANLLPGIRPRLSALNSIYELKDIKSIPHTLSLLKNTLSSTNKFKKLVLAAAKSKKLGFSQLYSLPLRKILKSVGDIYLQKEFNIEPMLSDMAAIRRSYLNIKKQVNNLLQDEGKAKRHYWRKALTSDYHDAVTTVNASGASYGVTYADTWTHVVTYRTALFNAEMEYSFVLKDYERDESLTRGALDSLGINADPGIIWRAIPWSFVVDWFIGVNRYLSQFALRNIEPTTYVSRFCFSTDVERWTTTSRSLTMTPGVPSSTDICTVFESAYTRQIIAPGLQKALSLNNLNSKEFWLAGALAVTR